PNRCRSRPPCKHAVKAAVTVRQPLRFRAARLHIWCDGAPKQAVTAATPELFEAVPTTVAGKSPFRLFWERLRGDKAALVGGVVDTTRSRFADVMLAVPQLLIAIGIVAACSTTKKGCVGGLIQPGVPVTIAVITFFSWAYIARIIRGFTLSLREKEFVESARSVGASTPQIIANEILPNLTGPLIVYTTLLIPTNILFE